MTDSAGNEVSGVKLDLILFELEISDKSIVALIHWAQDVPYSFGFFLLFLLGAIWIVVRGKVDKEKFRLQFENIRKEERERLAKNKPRPKAKKKPKPKIGRKRPSLTRSKKRKE